MKISLVVDSVVIGVQESRVWFDVGDGAQLHDDGHVLPRAEALVFAALVGGTIEVDVRPITTDTPVRVAP